jgi:hypothetical protein
MRYADDGCARARVLHALVALDAPESQHAAIDANATLGEDVVGVGRGCGRGEGQSEEGEEEVEEVHIGVVEGVCLKNAEFGVRGVPWSVWVWSRENWTLYRRTGQ